MKRILPNFLLCALCVYAVNLPAQTRTTIRDVLYYADGTRASGQVEIAWPPFTSADMKTIAGGRMTKRVTDGALEVSLVPNAGASPDGTSYAVNYLLSTGVSYAETWVVSSSALPLSVAAVRVSIVPSPAVLFAQQQLSLGAGLGVPLGLWRRATAPTATVSGLLYYDTAADQPMYSDGSLTWQTLVGGGGSVPDATPTVKGKLKLAGALGGTADSPTVPFLQAGTGAVARSTQDKLRDVVSVKDFGAVGDGATDDTAAIQAAIDTNNKVHLPKGTYLVSSQLSVTGANAAIEGDGPNATIIQSSANANKAIHITGEHHRLSGLRITGTASNAGGVQLGENGYYAAYVTFDDVRIDGFTGADAYGIRPYAMQEFHCFNCELRNNYYNLKYTGGTGAYITSSVFSGGASRLGGAGRNSVYATSAFADLTFRDVIFEGDARESIYLTNTVAQSSLWLTDCYYEGGNTSGLGTAAIRVDGAAGAYQENMLVVTGGKWHIPTVASPSLALDRVYAYIESSPGIFDAGAPTTTANTISVWKNNGQIGAADLKAEYKKLAGQVFAIDRDYSHGPFVVGPLGMESPGPIGNVIPSTGAFTDLAAGMIRAPSGVPAHVNGTQLEAYYTSGDDSAHIESLLRETAGPTWKPMHFYGSGFSFDVAYRGRLSLSTSGASPATIVDDLAAQTLQNKTLTLPTIASFANAGHNHQDAGGGGSLDGAAIGSGTVAAARLPLATDAARGAVTMSTASSSVAVATNDSRMTDARAPTIHAATHASGGSDAVALAPAQIAGTAVITSDARLSDARAPTAHAAGHRSGGSDALLSAPGAIGGVTPSTGAFTDLAAGMMRAPSGVPAPVNGTQLEAYYTSADDSAHIGSLLRETAGPTWKPMRFYGSEFTFDVAYRGRLSLSTSGSSPATIVDDLAAQTLKNKTLDNTNALSGYLDAAEIAAPASPSAGNQRLYAKAASGFCAKDSSGTERCTGSGDVFGPGSAVDSNFAAFNTTTGKLIKDSGSKAADFATAGHTHGTYGLTTTPGSTGTAPSWASQVLQLPMAATTGVTAGLISKTEYDSFAAKAATGTCTGKFARALGSSSLTCEAITDADVPDTLTAKVLTLPGLTAYTVATLPAAGTAGRVAVVTDAATAGSCTTGGGSALALCRDSGSAWVPLGDGGGGGTDIGTLITTSVWYAVGASVTRYLPLAYDGNNGGSGGADTPTPIAVAGTVQKWYGYFYGAQPASGNLNCWLMTNHGGSWATSALTLQVAAGAGGSGVTVSDTTHTQAISAGDLMEIKCVNSATATASRFVSQSFLIK